MRQWPPRLVFAHPARLRPARFDDADEDDRPNTAIKAAQIPSIETREWNKNSGSELEVKNREDLKKAGASHGSDNAVREMRKAIGPGYHHLRTHRPSMHQL